MVVCGLLLFLLLLAQRELGDHQVVVLVEVSEGDAVDTVDVSLLLLVDPGPHESGQEDCTSGSKERRESDQPPIRW